MALKLQMQLNKPDEFWLEVFHTDAVAAGDSVDIADGITLTNMSKGSRGVSGVDLLTFLIENKESIAAGIVSSAIYDLIKGFASRALLNGKAVTSKEDVTQVIGAETDADKKDAAADDKEDNSG